MTRYEQLRDDLIRNFDSFQEGMPPGGTAEANEIVASRLAKSIVDAFPALTFNVVGEMPCGEINAYQKTCGDIFCTTDAGNLFGAETLVSEANWIVWWSGDRFKKVYGGVVSPSPTPTPPSVTPSDATPQMDGEGSAGASAEYSRGDHVHPHDDSKADKVSGATNGNLAALDASGNIKDSGKSSGDFASNAPTFSQASSRTNINSGETMPTILGKVKKWFADLKALAFKDKVSNADINGTLSDSHIASASTWNGKYTKPSDGIPKSDLASAVQTSLGLADTALQQHQSLDGYVNGITTDGTTTFVDTSTIVVGKSGKNVLTRTALALYNYIKGQLAAVAVSGSYKDLSDKPTIPPAITVDSALSTTSTNPVQNKAVKTALDSKVNTSDIIAITHGGTGAASPIAAEYSLLNHVEDISTTLTDERKIALCNNTKSASNGVFRWIPLSYVWTWILTHLGALGTKDKVSNADIDGTLSDSHIASASTWNNKASSSDIKNGTTTFTKNGQNIGTVSANQSTNNTIEVGGDGGGGHVTDAQTTSFKYVRVARLREIDSNNFDCLFGEFQVTSIDNKDVQAGSVYQRSVFARYEVAARRNYDEHPGQRTIWLKKNKFIGNNEEMDPNIVGMGLVSSINANNRLVVDIYCKLSSLTSASVHVSVKALNYGCSASNNGVCAIEYFDSETPTTTEPTGFLDAITVTEMNSYGYVTNTTANAYYKLATLRQNFESSTESVFGSFSVIIGDNKVEASGVQTFGTYNVAATHQGVNFGTGSLKTNEFIVNRTVNGVTLYCHYAVNNTKMYVDIYVRDTVGNRSIMLRPNNLMMSCQGNADGYPDSVVTVFFRNTSYTPTSSREVAATQKVINGNADTVDGYHIVVGTNPGTDPNTLYIW